jgi:membrane-associated phospholipid phosphatase
MSLTSHLFKRLENIKNKIPSLLKHKDILAPVIGVVMPIIFRDYRGLLQSIVQYIISLGFTHFLKGIVKRKRPDGSNDKSFPSAHTTSCAAVASFAYRRYGLLYSAPLWGITAKMGKERVESKKHHVTDVLASVASSMLFSYVTTSPATTYGSLVNLASSSVSKPKF